MFSALHEAVNKLMDGFFQQQEENKRLNNRCDELQTELREIQTRLTADHAEFERRIEAASSKNLTLDHVLVGFIINNASIFIHKDADETSELFKWFARGNGRFIIESLQHFKNFKKIDLWDWGSVRFIDRQGNPITESVGSLSLEKMSSDPGLKKLYKVCKELGIKFVFSGSDTFKGVPIDKILS